MTQDGPTTAKQSGGGTVVLIILSLAMFVYVSPGIPKVQLEMKDL